ncbi:MAG TPA: hypothetical protein VE078_14535 [Thermoanaerobaculia bacterium]|nr:hypothetical protein [Thermoanaerobaculia bacterium]
MGHARPEYQIILALIGILLAVGIPSILRGQLVLGSVCVGLAAVVTGWFILALIRSRK